MTCKFRFFYNKCITQYIKSLLNTSYNELLQSIFNLDSQKFFLAIKSNRVLEIESLSNFVYLKYTIKKKNKKTRTKFTRHEINSNPFLDTSTNSTTIT